MCNVSMGGPREKLSGQTRREGLDKTHGLICRKRVTRRINLEKGVGRLGTNLWRLNDGLTWANQRNMYPGVNERNKECKDEPDELLSRRCVVG